MKNLFICSIIVPCILSSAAIFAVGTPVANQFENGKVADANDVNANFQELADRISDTLKGDKGDPGTPGVNGSDGTGIIEVSADGYKHTHASKTFSVTFTDGISVPTPGWDTETQTFDRGVANQLTVTRVRSRAAVLRKHDELTYTVGTGVDTVLTKRKIFSVVSGAINENTTTITFPSGITTRKAVMAVGHPWGSMVDTSKTASPALPNDEPIPGNAVETRTLLEKVPAMTLNNSNSYTDCIKISSTRMSHIGSSHLRMSWYCADHGLVKRTQMSPRTNFSVDANGAVSSVTIVYRGINMELESFNNDQPL